MEEQWDHLPSPPQSLQPMPQRSKPSCPQNPCSIPQQCPLLTATSRGLLDSSDSQFICSALMSQASLVQKHMAVGGDNQEVLLAIGTQHVGTRSSFSFLGWERLLIRKVCHRLNYLDITSGVGHGRSLTGGLSCRLVDIQPLHHI